MTPSIHNIVKCWCLALCLKKRKSKVHTIYTHMLLKKKVILVQH